MCRVNLSFYTGDFSIRLVLRFCPPPDEIHKTGKKNESFIFLRSFKGHPFKVLPQVIAPSLSSVFFDHPERDFFSGQYNLLTLLPISMAL